MEGNPNDKMLREKLQSAEYPFDPQAWAQMEGMLDANKKRRGMIWWSSLNVALLLLLSTYVYSEMHGMKTGQIAANSTDRNTHMIANIEINSQSSTANGMQTTNDERQTTIDTKQNTIGIQQSTANTNQISENKRQTTINANTKNAQLSAVNKSRKKYPLSSIKHPETRSQQPASSIQQPITRSYPQTASVEKSTSLRSYEMTGIEMQPSSLNAISYLCFEENNDDGVQSIPAKLKGRHKVNITYKLGVEAGVCAAFVAKTWADKPTWNIGLAQEVQIGKYFAITNSILYSEVNFKVDHPAYPDNTNSTLDGYHSHIRELAIPIGVKVYPYSNKLIKVGIGIAYVNHIKLKETFDYKLTPQQPSQQLIPLFDATSFPSVNTFTEPEKTTYNTLGMVPPSHPNVIADYYSIGKGKRYYGSLLYTVGVEIALPHRFVFTAEPCMMMSLDKIRMQNSRVFDFGMNTGVKYAF